MSHALITDSVHPVCEELLRKQGYRVDVAPGASEEELLGKVKGVNAWVIRSGTQISEALIDAADELEVIGRAGVGVDNVDIPAATRKGVLVLNAPDGNTISTAEHTCAMLMSLARRVPHAAASMREGRWDRKNFAGSELYRKTLGVVGVGKIGRAVAARMRSFDMEILGFDPLLSPEHAEKLGIRLVDFEELIAGSDYITIHTPLIASTKRLFGSDVFQRCKNGVCIVNCARGGIVDELALAAALESGQVAGAALDVFEEEPPDASRKALIDHPKVVTTPHIAASTAEAQERVARQVAEQVINALEGRPVATAVNAAAVSSAASPEIKPYLQLANKLGRVVAQLHHGPVKKITIGCRGDLTRNYRDVLMVAATQGVLSERLSDPVNLVNAMALAEDAGIPLGIDLAEAPAGYSELLEVCITSADESKSATGSVFARGDLRMLELDGYPLELRLEGTFLVYHNEDRPGMLAAVGSILAADDINIGSMALGRSGLGRLAMTAMQVDEVPGADVLDAIREVRGVERVSLLRV